MGTEQEIFDAAMQDDEPDAPTPQAPGAADDEAPQPAPAAPEPPQGQNEPDAALSAAPQPDPAPPQHQVPLAELLNTRERAQKAEQERDQLRQWREAVERERRAQEDAARQQKPQFPDPLMDQEGYNNFVLQQQQALEQTIWQRLDNLETQKAIYRAKQSHGELFDKAWTDFTQEAKQNPALAQVWQQLPPWQRADEVIGWYKQQQTLREIGNDPAAYKAKLQEQLLNDPAFQAQVAEKLRASLSQPAQTRPQNVTRLPPSMNRVAGAAPAHSADDEDGSEEAIFAAAMAPRRRR
jgi:hypothetical protein